MRNNTWFDKIIKNKGIERDEIITVILDDEVFKLTCGEIVDFIKGLDFSLREDFKLGMLKLDYVNSDFRKFLEFTGGLMIKYEGEL